MNDNDVMSGPDYTVNLSSLGPQREPFAEAVDDEQFYFDPTRTQRLNLLLHLAPYSELLLVTGVHGSGKTSLLRQFILRAASRWQVAVVVADTTMSVEMLVRRICEEAGIGMSEADEDPVMLLIDRINALGLAAKSLILVIDDAHELSDQGLKIVQRLLEASNASGKPLTVIFFGAPSLLQLIKRPEYEALNRRCSHMLDVPPLNEEHTGEYLRHRLAVSGHDPQAFSTAAIKKIFRLSGGLPARINELARHQLAHPEEPAEISGVDHLVSTTRRSVNPIHWAIGIAALLAIVFYWPKEVKQPPVPAEPAPLAQQLPAESQFAPPPKEETPPSMSSEVTEESNTVAERSNEAMVPAITTVETAGSQEETGVEILPLPDRSSPGEQIAKPASREAQTAEAASQEDAMPAISPVAEAGTDKPVTTGKPQPTVAIPAPDTGKSAAQPVAKTPAEVKASADAGGIQREQWLLQQQPESYTLQLMASDKEASIQSFIESRHLKGDIAYFETRRNGAAWYAVVYSIYPSRDMAVAASKNLPSALTDIKPWVRSIGSIQNDIRSAKPQ